MKFINSLLSLLGIFALLCLGGCAHYRPRAMQKLTTGVNQNSKEKSIAFASHALTKGECKAYLDRNVLAQGFQAIQIAITNSSNRTFRFELDNISIPTVNSDIVARTVHTNTAGRAIGYGIAGLFIWPLIIPAIVDGIGSSNANHELDADYAKKALHSQLIDPHSTISGIIFVEREDYYKDFTVIVIDQETGEKMVLSDSKPKIKL